MENHDQLILSHYAQVAKTHGEGGKCTMKDEYIRAREVDFVTGEINHYKDDKGKDPLILDVGCGNGYILSQVHQQFPELQCFGVEFTPELLAIATSLDLKNVSFALGDIRRPDFYPDKVDVIIGNRVLINILNEQHLAEAMKNIVETLRSGGRYIMTESFDEPFQNINRARKEMKIPPLSWSKQNRYLTEKNMQYFCSLGMKEIDGKMKVNHLSTHFYLTRVFHHILRPEGSRMEGGEFVKFFDQALPPAVGNYSPILFRVFEKSI